MEQLQKKHLFGMLRKVTGMIFSITFATFDECEGKPLLGLEEAQWTGSARKLHLDLSSDRKDYHHADMMIVKLWQIAEKTWEGGGRG